jgi:hypothetical protein
MEFFKQYNGTLRVIVVIWIIIILLTAFFSYRAGKNSIVIRDTITITKETRDTIRYTDTVFYEKLIPVYIKTVDSIAYYINDTTYIHLPKEQAFYRDSLYEAWVSGVFPQLDSIRIFKEKLMITHTIENTITNYIQPPKWGIGIYGGIGVQYGVLTRKFDFGPQIGVGFYYKINNKKKQ